MTPTDPPALPPLVIIPCGKAKLDRPASAGAMYTGGYHRACRRAADILTSPGRIRIISAKYGLISLGQLIEPYELRMGQLGSITHDQLRAQAHAEGLVDEPAVVILAGRDYATPVLRIWPEAWPAVRA